MFKYIKRIFFLVSLIMIYMIVREFLSLYSYLISIDRTFANIIIGFIGVVFIYFGLIPLFKIALLPSGYGPVKYPEKKDILLKKRLKALESNKLLVDVSFQIEDNYESRLQLYERILPILNKRCQEIRKDYVNRVFYSTSISQNGFIDGIIMIITSVNLVKDIFQLYNGRVSLKDFWYVIKQIYYSTAIAGSESFEYITNEILTKISSEVIKNIPFFNKITSSFVDGYINAILLTRIGIITENYCTKIYVKDSKELMPSPTFVFKTTKDIVGDLVNLISGNLVNNTKEKVGEVFSKIGQPFKKNSENTSDTTSGFSRIKSLFSFRRNKGN